ncbi:MAG: hypothetical protein JRH01_00880 [Deltaproteobacteria bacterium]|nr:hypothetical protein [Deltaproteobacteria bacterium]MBW2392871.1 hypothetical protein [Deltaproteobacteria bacterium]
MSEDPEFNLKALLGIVEKEKSEPTPFAQSVGAALGKAITSMRAEGVIEVEDANVEPLVAEVTNSALESSSLKRLVLRVVKTLIHSDLVEEVYGTDEEISASLRPFLDAV